MTQSSEMAIRVRMLGADDWQLWRKLRLEALEEAPYAFSSKLADWQGDGDTEARWRARLSAVPINLVAELYEMPAGMVSATAQNLSGTVELISMWVAPFARGRGVGDHLVSAVVKWAQEQQAARIVLAVLEGNEAAAALYLRHGFVDGEASTQDCSGMARERQMVRDL